MWNDNNRNVYGTVWWKAITDYRSYWREIRIDMELFTTCCKEGKVNFSFHTIWGFCVWRYPRIDIHIYTDLYVCTGRQCLPGHPSVVMITGGFCWHTVLNRYEFWRPAQTWQCVMVSYPPWQPRQWVVTSLPGLHCQQNVTMQVCSFASRTVTESWTQ